MPQTTRRRVTKSTTVKWQTEFFHDGYWENAGTGEVTFLNRQITTSEGHAWPRDRGVRDAGGPFDTIKLEYRNDSGMGIHSALYPYSIFQARSVGHAFPHYAWHSDFHRLYGPEWTTDSDYNAMAPASSDTLTVPGTKFIAETIPTNPMLDASVSLAELYREGLPSLLGASLLKDKVGLFRGIAGDYLSYQFGWKPIVSDLKAAAKAIMDQESILQQLERDSGRDVHRKRTLPTETVDQWEFPQGETAYPSGMQHTAFVGPSRFTYSAKHMRTQWFSGCYTYYFEPKKMAEVSRIATEARHLYGLELTPEVVWNLAPWSWLIDWITNVGDVFHNVSAFSQDGLILRYGYVMEQNSRAVARNSTVQFSPNLVGNYPTHTRDVFSAIRKMRRKATPYGFGLLESSFSVRQWAILAALGITRAPK